MSYRTASCAMALLLAGMCTPEAVRAQSVWRYTHPESKVIAGVEWRRVAASRLGKELRATISEANTPGIPGLEQLRLFDSADRIILSAPLPAQAQQSSSNKGLVVVEGRFDWPALRKALLGQGARVRMLAGKEILVAKQTSGMDGVLALAEPGILLAGDLQSVEAALKGAAMPETSPLYRRATALAARTDIWFVGVVPPGAMPPDAGPQAKMMADVTGFEFGLNLRRGVGFDLSVTTKTKESADTLAGGLRMILSMAAMQQPNKPEMAALLEKAQIAATQSEVRLSLHLDETELDKSFRSLRAALPGGMQPVQVRPVYRGEKNITWPSAVAGGAAQTPAVAEAQKPPERQVIRLYGAEGGTREIPLENR
jgi:hypothetical protein